MTLPGRKIMSKIGLGEVLLDPALDAFVHLLRVRLSEQCFCEEPARPQRSSFSSPCTPAVSVCPDPIPSRTASIAPFFVLLVRQVLFKIATHCIGQRLIPSFGLFSSMQARPRLRSSESTMRRPHLRLLEADCRRRFQPRRT